MSADEGEQTGAVVPLKVQEYWKSVYKNHAEQLL